VDFKILGTTGVSEGEGGRNLNIGGPQRRAVLTYLIVHRDQPVSLDQLVADLGTGQEAAPSAGTIRQHLSKLSDVLGRDRVTEVAAGYKLRFDPEDLDATRFAAEIEAAAALLERNDPAAASVEVSRALSRWYGPPLRDVAGAPWAEATAAALDALHDRAEAIWNDPRVAAHRTRPLPIVGANPPTLTQSPDPGTAPETPSARLARQRMGNRWQGELPEGTLTFLMTDIVGSTRLWEQVPDLMEGALRRHDDLIAEAVSAHQGQVIREKGEGDSTFSVFSRATHGAAAALAAQKALESEPWPEGCVISARMAMLTGEAILRGRDYYGPAVNRTARIRAYSSGGQILIGRASAEIIWELLPPGGHLSFYAEVELRGMSRPESIHLLSSEPPPEPEPGPAVPEQEPARWDLVVSVDPDYFADHGQDGVVLPVRPPHRIVLQSASVEIGRCDPHTGANPDIDLSGPLEDTGVSRRQARLERHADGSWFVVDERSGNGTFVNDREIQKGVPTRVEPGDRIYIGTWTRLTIEPHDPEAAPG
jgi:class 3 adenylate cyclase